MHENNWVAHYAENWPNFFKFVICNTLINLDILAYFCFIITSAVFLPKETTHFDVLFTLKVISYHYKKHDLKHILSQLPYNIIQCKSFTPARQLRERWSKTRHTSLTPLAECLFSQLLLTRWINPPEWAFSWFILGTWYFHKVTV